MINETKKACLIDDIAAYVDGELAPEREIEMDIHFTTCAPCLNELNEQKRFLRQLEFSLHEEQHLELPANFTKLVVANAESTVSGLRRPGERYNALFICVGLSLFVLFASGAEAGRVISGLTQVADQIAAVASFFGHLVYSLFLGVVIVLRTVGSHVSMDALSVLALLAVSIFILAALSKRVLRTGRA